MYKLTTNDSRAFAKHKGRAIPKFFDLHLTQKIPQWTPLDLKVFDCNFFNFISLSERHGWIPYKVKTVDYYSMTCFLVLPGNFVNDKKGIYCWIFFILLKKLTACLAYMYCFGVPFYSLQKLDLRKEVKLTLFIILDLHLKEFKFSCVMNLNIKWNRNLHFSYYWFLLRNSYIQRYLCISNFVNEIL